MSEGETTQANQRLYRMSQDPGSDHLIKFLINNEHLIREKLMILEGYRFNVMTNKYEDYPEREPKLNEKGINFAMNELNHVLNKFVVQTSLDVQQVEKFMESYSTRIITAIGCDWDNYGIKSEQDASQIVAVLTDTTNFALRQVIDDKSRKFMYSPLKVVESRSFQENNVSQSRQKTGW
jgi:hypothetical protein